MWELVGGGGDLDIFSLKKNSLPPGQTIGQNPQPGDKWRAANVKIPTPVTDVVNNFLFVDRRTPPLGLNMLHFILDIEPVCQGLYQFFDILSHGF